MAASFNSSTDYDQPDLSTHYGVYQLLNLRNIYQSLKMDLPPSHYQVIYPDLQHRDKASMLIETRNEMVKIVAFMLEMDVEALNRLLRPEFNTLTRDPLESFCDFYKRKLNMDDIVYRHRIAFLQQRVYPFFSDLEFLCNLLDEAAAIERARRAIPTFQATAAPDATNASAPPAPEASTSNNTWTPQFGAHPPPGFSSMPTPIVIMRERLVRSPGFDITTRTWRSVSYWVRTLYYHGIFSNSNRSGFFTSIRGCYRAHDEFRP